MEQLSDFADDRLVDGCIYCGGLPDTREHVPSRCLLDKPFPSNLPVVGACKCCNSGFSHDEEYLACLLDVVLAGSTDPSQLQRSAVAKTLARSPTLRQRFDEARWDQDGRVTFSVEVERVKNVMVKLARGHSVFELSVVRRDEPDYFWCLPLGSLSDDEARAFNAAHIVSLLGEIGSRNTQRLQAAVVTLQSASGEIVKHEVLVNDWIEVQAGRYRYLAIDEVGGITIRMVLSEYLACEVIWLDDEHQWDVQQLAEGEE